MLKKLITIFVILATAGGGVQPAAAAGWTPVPLTGVDDTVCRPEAPSREHCIPWMADNGQAVFSQKLQWEQIEERDLTAAEQAEMFGQRTPAAGANTKGLKKENGAWKIDSSRFGHFGSTVPVHRLDGGLLVGIYDRLNYTLRILAIRVAIGAPLDDAGTRHKALKLRVSQAVVPPTYFDSLKTAAIWKDGAAVE